MSIDTTIERVEAVLERTLTYISDHQADDAKNLAIALKKLEEVRRLRTRKTASPGEAV